VSERKENGERLRERERERERYDDEARVIKEEEGRRTRKEAG